MWSSVSSLRVLTGGRAMKEEEVEEDKEEEK
jgi:hypothetical protein